MDNTLKDNSNNKDNNWKISNFDQQEKKSEIIEELNMPSYKDGINFVIEQNPELLNILYNSLGYTPLSNDEKKELYTLLRSPLFNKIRNTKEYEKYNWWILPAHEFSEENFNLLITWIKNNNINTDHILYEFERSKELSEKYDIIKEWEVFSFFDPKSWELKGYASNEEKKLWLEQIQHKINLFRFFKESERKVEAKKIYAEYIKTIFPESKVKNIVWHSSDTKITSFSHQKEGLWQFFFSNGKDTIWKLLANPESEAEQVAVLLNIKNPKIEDFDENNHEVQSYWMRFAPKEWYDSVLIENIQNPEDSERVVFKPEQIHILWSEKDFKQLKEWLNSKK